MSKQRVVVVGMGFAGVNVALGLAGTECEVLLIDRNNYHLFQPLLYQVATAGLEQESIAYPIRALTRNWNNLTFKMAEVTGIDRQSRQIMTSTGIVPYDYLVVAGGSETNFFGNHAIATHAHELKRLPDAECLRNKVLNIFEAAVQEQDHLRRTEMLSFVVVGGGPTGVEFAGALIELIRYVLHKDYPSIRMEECRVLLIEAAPSILTSLPPKLQTYALDKLQSMGVEVLCNTVVSDASDTMVRLGSGEVIPSRTLFWSAGVKANPLAGSLKSETGPHGRVLVSDSLRLPEDERVYVIGDMACPPFTDSALPMMAPVAMQQGRYVARALLAQIRSGSVGPFSYVDKGSMATIGRKSAVASAFGLSFSGFSAWLVWLFLHLYYLIGFRNRIVVLLNWSWYYWFHERQVRLITVMQRENLSQGG